MWAKSFSKCLSTRSLQVILQQVLDDAANIVITESTAKALFGNEDPMGKVVRVDNQHDLKVAGILKDIPTNSSLQFDFLLPYKHWYNTNDWVKRNCHQLGQLFIPGIR